ncbi:hypothetical protein C8R44DRAFT_869496 [Mycena epipterygia]|nr:hypothetical protein C8R44DRAFT_869496 [Mycena epipterygia]
MSGSTAGLSPAQIQYQVNASTCFTTAAFTILFYDYFLTLDRETSRYWGSRMTWATLFFYLNRYGLLLGAIPVIAQYFWDDPTKAKVCMWQYVTCTILTFDPVTRCPAFGTYYESLVFFSQLVIAIISIMRTYALFDRSRLVLGFMLFVTVGFGVFGIYTMVVVRHNAPGPAPMFLPSAPMEFQPQGGCAGPLSVSVSRLFGASWAGLLFFDCMILSLTAWKAFLSYNKPSGRLISILVRHGALFFLVMALLHAGNITSFFRAGIQLHGPYDYARGLTTSTTNVLSSILISRFMLNLRDPKLLADNSSLIWDTARRPELHISTVEPYYGSAHYGSESQDEEDDIGQILDHRMSFIFTPLMLRLTR